MNNQDQCGAAQDPPLCATGCGFFGNPANMNMCSKCFREHQAKEQAAQAPAPVPMQTDLASLVETAKKESAPSPAPAPAPAPAAAGSPAGSPAGPAAGSPAAAPSPAPSPAAAAAPSPAPAPAPAPMCVVVPEPAPAAASSPAAAAGGQEGEEGAVCRPVQKNTSRCWSCKKKVGLTGFKCKCGYVYCGTHRYSDRHDCDFDYKSSGRDAIAKANPVIKAQKLQQF